MKTVEYLSPSSITQYYKNKDEFYLRYLSETPPPKFPQTQPMSIGSSFDAYVKSHLYETLFGKGHNPKYDFNALFEAQVEEHNRDWAFQAGRYAFECYKISGALSDLLLQLHKASKPPRFEFDLHGAVNGYREGVTKDIGAVIFLGKPDLHYVNSEGLDVTHDWKVNGFCGKSNTSPKKGYVRLRDGWRDKVESRSNNAQHKDAIVMNHKGIMVNHGHSLNMVDAEWAQQLSIYSWLLGLEIGAQFVVSIDQLACSNVGTTYPDIRIAEHRCFVNQMFQFETFARAQVVWKNVHSDHFFDDKTKEESDARCKALDAAAAGLKGGTVEDEWFASVCRVA